MKNTAAERSVLPGIVLQAVVNLDRRPSSIIRYAEVDGAARRLVRIFYTGPMMSLVTSASCCALGSPRMLWIAPLSLEPSGCLAFLSPHMYERQDAQSTQAGAVPQVRFDSRNAHWRCQTIEMRYILPNRAHGRLGGHPGRLCMGRRSCGMRRLPACGGNHRGDGCLADAYPERSAAAWVSLRTR